MKVKIGKFKNNKAAGKDEVIGARQGVGMS